MAIYSEISSFQVFRDRARDALLEHQEPKAVQFVTSKREQEQGSLFPPLPAPKVLKRRRKTKRPFVPASFLLRAQTVAHHRDPGRWNLLYRLLWRMTFESKDLFQKTLDPDVAKFIELEKSVHAEVHRCQAYVRFYPATVSTLPPAIRAFFDQGGTGTNRATVWAAWVEPVHPILPLAAPFFQRRFGGMPWIIVTPAQAAIWDTFALKYVDGPFDEIIGLTKEGEDIGDLWRTYYGSTFNPKRPVLKKVPEPMPKRYWRHLPDEKPEELDGAEARIPRSRARSVKVAEPPPDARSLAQVKDAASTCTACPLYKTGTQTVFGAGEVSASIMLVGEQPGDEEDLQGIPFVGPAGEVLAEVLTAAGINRKDIYVTNAVKHFKWVPRGKRRIHQKPNLTEIRACRGWLEAELRLVRPRIVVCLGATAAQSVLGRPAKIGAERGKIIDGPHGITCVISYHPSAALRVPTKEKRDAVLENLVADLSLARKTARQSNSRNSGL